MSRIMLTDELRDDYRTMFATCVVRQEQAAEVDEITNALAKERERYQLVGQRLNVPWFVVAVLHESDTGRDFSALLHTGDPLTDRTRHLPDGRPIEGEPPFRWEDSATDALRLYHFDLWQDWSIAGILFLLEGRGGWGYRLHHPDVPSPYLWNYSTHYIKGKYVTDDTWSEVSIAQRCGAAVLLRRLAECNLIEFDDPEDRPDWPLLRYDEGVASPWVEALQCFMNSLPGIYVKVDGRAGPRTSEVFYKLAGLYLPGDPRSKG